MKYRFLSACVLAACVCGLLSGAGVAAQETKQAEVKVSGGERSAYEKITKAAGPEAKIQAASEFLKKYPQSPLRPQVAESVAAEISAVTDAQLKVSLAETYLALFNAPGEGDRVGFMLLDAYIAGDRAVEAFRAAGPWFQKNPDDVDTLRRLTTTALNASILGNNSFLAQGQQFGTKALEMIEADKRPANIDEARWAAYKAESVPALHRELGIIAFRAGDRDVARKHLARAAELKHADPNVYLILAQMSDEDYSLLAKQYQIMPAGAEKAAFLPKVEASLDQTIDAFAQALAITEGNAQYQAASTQLRQDIESYYKFRHNGSTEGLQQLIDKYKRK
jgi:tetratricopeptide (TPR) repeat protein